MSLLIPVYVHYHKPRTPAPVVPPELSLVQKAKNLAVAGKDILAHKLEHGGPLRVPPEVEAARLEICRTRCPAGAWIPGGNLGLGECRLCGCCTKFKPMFAAMKCPAPVPAWEAYHA